MIKIAKVVGLNSDTACAQTLVCQGRMEGELYVLVTSEGEDAFSKVRFALSEAEGVFFTSSEPAVERLQEVYDSIKKNLVSLENIQILVSLVMPSETDQRPLYLLSKAQTINALLIRNKEIMNLISPSETPQLISGFLHPGDRMVLTTQTLIDLLGSEEGLVDIPLETFDEEVSSHFPQGQVYPTAVVVIELEPEMVVSDQLSPSPAYTGHRLPIDRPRFSRRTLGLLGVILFGVLIVGGFMAWQKQSATPEVLDQQPSEGEVKPANLYEISEILTWLDLNLIKADFKATNLSTSLGRILVLDVNLGSLVEINLGSKTHKLLAGKDKLGEAEKAALNGSFAFVYSTDKGLVRVNTEELEVKNIILKDDEWGEVTQIYGFGSNIYLLDQGKSQIWKYVPVENGYSDRIFYLMDDVKVDLSKSIRLQIDSSVWVLNQDGGLKKFTQGAQDSFNYSGLDRGVNSPKSFFVSDETENLYLLDSGNNRLLVLNKSGQYQAQYLHSMMGEFIDLVVDEENKRVYLLDGRKIYVLELK